MKRMIRLQMDSATKDKLIFGVMHLVDDQELINLVIDLVENRPEELKNQLIIAINRTKQ